MVVRAVCFDAVGTLLFPEPPAHVVYAQVGARYGSRRAAAEVRERFAAAFAREEALDLADDLRTSEEREYRRWQAIVASVLDDASDPEACFRELYEHFQRPAAWRCAPWAEKVLERLDAKGHRLAVASNYDHRLRSVVVGLAPLRFVRRLIISSEVGWRKPSPRFFEAVCRELGLPPEQILFVGDDPHNDVEGARRAGMPALRVDPANAAAQLAHLLSP